MSYFLKLHSSQCSSSALAKTIYRLSDRANIILNSIENDLFEVSINPIAEIEQESLTTTFLTILNDYFLREEISKKTEGVRTLLLAQAFSKALKSLDESES